jgi:glucosamine kinase
MNGTYLIGVDGGGTHTRVAVATIDGIIIGRGKAGSGNIATDLENATQNILAAVQDAVKSASLPENTVRLSFAYLGLAGANIGNFAELLAQKLPFVHHHIGDDVQTALVGALGSHDGAIAILGTGSAFMSKIGSDLRMIGGWGFQLSDLGGGARMGREALELTLLAHDGVVKASPLTDALFKKFNNNPENCVLFAQSARPNDYGALTPIITDHLLQNDPNARILFENSAHYVNRAFDALALNENAPIALLGGMAAFYPKFLSPHHQKRLIEPKSDALTGAIILARAIANGTQIAKIRKDQP